MNNAFGKFVRDKRTLAGLSLRELASELGVSPVHLSNIEWGKRSVPHGEIIKRMADALHLNEKDRIKLFDLAANSKSYISAPYDISCYVSDNEVVKNALRTAEKNNISKDQWLAFIEDIS